MSFGHEQLTGSLYNADLIKDCLTYQDRYEQAKDEVMSNRGEYE